jgi:inner membrane protein
MLVAEAACELGGARRPEFRRAAYLTSALANNLPDIDPVYTWITKPPPLGSLLHHRGHTHTLLLALPAGLLLALAVLRALASRHGAFSRPERLTVCALGACGAGLHILMDFGNNYGVHPFWPLSNSWFYGDTIFIVEPLWLAIALPALASAVSPRWLKWLLGGLLGILLLLAVRLPIVSAGTLLAVCALAAVSGVIGWRGSPRLRIVAAGSGWIGVALVFIAMSWRTDAVLRASMRADFPALTVRDLITTPMPGNPLCWNAWVIATSDREYYAFEASVAPVPGWTNAGQCPFDSAAMPTARLFPVARSGSPALRWHGQYTTERADLTQLASTDCRFRALLQFARAPYIAAQARIAGDLRFDRSPGTDFSDLRLDGDRECPKLLPPWTPPRSDILGADSEP